jgi:lipoprotein NlpD
VYSGAGLKGYGNLVIIKHDERYLSAYGFNRRLHVAQGDSVDAGQHIADVGRGPENRPLLYFEIRRDGEPVDPQRLLPGK